MANVIVVYTLIEQPLERHAIHYPCRRFFAVRPFFSVLLGSVRCSQSNTVAYKLGPSTVLSLQERDYVLVVTTLTCEMQSVGHNPHEHKLPE